MKHNRLFFISKRFNAKNISFVGAIVVLLLFWTEATFALASQGTLSPEELYGLNESQWSEFAAVSDPQNLPHDAVVLLMRRLQRPLIQSIIWDHATQYSTSVAVKFQEKSFQGAVWDFEAGSLLTINSFRIVEFDREENPDSKIKVDTIDRFYICSLRTGDGMNLFCLTPEIPRGWNPDQKSDFWKTPVKTGFLGVQISGLKIEKIPIFVAPRLRWYPDTFLGNHAMDVSALQAVTPIPIDTLIATADEKSRRKRPTPEQMQVLRFTQRDCEPFYQLLQVAAVIPGEEIEQEIAKENERNLSTPQELTVDLFNRPQYQQGRLVRLVGIARRIERVSIDDEEIVKRFGFDHYYQIAVFTTYSQGNPIIFCIKDIPEELPLGNQDDFQVAISICGFFYKTWAYKKTGVANVPGDKSAYQFAPLVVASKIDWFQLPAEVTRFSTSINALSFTSLVFVILLFLWIGVRCFSRRGRVY